MQLEILMKALHTVAGVLLHVTDPPQFSLIAFDFFPLKKRFLVRQWKKAVFVKSQKRSRYHSERSKCGEGSFRMRILDRSQNLNLDWTKGTQP